MNYHLYWTENQTNIKILRSRIVKVYCFSEKDGSPESEVRRGKKPAIK